VGENFTLKVGFGVELDLKSTFYEISKSILVRFKFVMLCRWL